MGKEVLRDSSGDERVGSDIGSGREEKVEDLEKEVHQR